MRKRWMAAIVCAAILLVASCASSASKSPLTLVQRAGDAVIAAKTARIEMRFESAGQSFTMDGQLDFVNKQGAFSMDIPSVVSFEGVYKGTDMFVRAGGTGWTRIQMKGDLAEQALQGLGADPRAMLEQLSGAGGITEQGTEEIRGVSTTHFSGTIDFDKALEAQGTPQAQIDQLKTQAKSMGTLSSSVDVYLDDSGLAHRTVSHVKVGQAFVITMTMDLLDFGKPVNITMPSPSEVVATRSASSQYEMNQLMQALVAGR